VGFGRLREPDSEELDEEYMMMNGKRYKADQKEYTE